jgi:hypothetical protein
MTIYPDTTFFVALRFFDDIRHEAAVNTRRRTGATCCVSLTT